MSRVQTSGNTFSEKEMNLKAQRANLSRDAWLNLPLRCVFTSFCLLRHLILKPITIYLDHHFIDFFFKFQNIVELILISLEQSLQYVISHIVVLI